MSEGELEAQRQRRGEKREYMIKVACLIIVPGIKSLARRERFTTTYEFPRGALSLASFLNSRDCRTMILPLDYYLQASDSPLNIEKQTFSILQEALNEYAPSVVGVSAPYTLLYPASLKIVEYCKKIKPDLFTIMGGPHVTYLHKHALRDSDSIDIVVRGEGEWTLLETVDSLIKGNDISHIKGIAYRSNNDTVVTPDRPFGPVSELPVLEYGLLPENFVRNMSISLVASRGCVYRCAYCSESLFWGNKVRRIPVENIFEELKQLSDKYDNLPVGLEDSMFHMKSSYFYELCSKLTDIKLNPNIYLLSRVDTVNDDGFNAMIKAGIRNIILGVESASPKVLGMMSKHITPYKAENACEKATKKGLVTGTFWIIGHPGDDPQEAEMTIHAIDTFYEKGVIGSAEIALFVPYPGTPMFNDPQKYGIEILTYEWEKWGRFNTEPVIQLKGFSKKEILTSWTRARAVSEKWRLNLINKRLHTVSDPNEYSIGESRKIGRNEPCPCGSGKKYKKCCIR